MFIDGNIGLSDLQEHLPDAVISKLHLNFTGKQPLNHPDEVELVERMLLNGKEMFKVSIFLIFLLYKVFVFLGRVGVFGFQQFETFISQCI